MNRGEEDYIKKIYELAYDIDYDIEDPSFVGNHQLARSFGFSVQTVNEMVKKLAKKGLLEYKPYKGSRLTELGKKKAVNLVRIHRIWEEFLVNRLGYSWKEVHEDAELLEHVTSPLLVERLYEFLGQPSYCPHGSPIPDLNGNIKDRALISLDRCQVDRDYVLRRVIDEAAILTFLDKIELAIGTLVRVGDIDGINKNIIVVANERQFFIGYDVAKKIFLEEI